MPDVGLSKRSIRDIVRRDRWAEAYYLETMSAYETLVRQDAITVTVQIPWPFGYLPREWKTKEELKQIYG